MTRDDILDAAAQVFRQKGFHGSSMADIAETVQLQKASLYHHVSSKQEILLALLDRGLEMLFEQIDVIASSPCLLMRSCTRWCRFIYVCWPKTATFRLCCCLNTAPSNLPNINAISQIGIVSSRYGGMCWRTVSDLGCSVVPTRALRSAL